MKKEEKLLRQGIEQLGLDFSDEAIRRLLTYLDELLKWNRKMNLIGSAPVAEVIESHFLDSLTLLPLADSLAAGGSILDIGSGAGFPGLALKAARPWLAVTLAEPRQKRCAFLRHASRTMGLSAGLDIRDLFLRPEAPPADLAGQFGLVVSRAVTELGDFLALAAPFTRPGGVVVCMKGPRAAAELAAWEARKTPEEAYEMGEIRTIALPFSKATRHLVSFRKGVTSDGKQDDQG